MSSTGIDVCRSNHGYYLGVCHGNRADGCQSLATVIDRLVQMGIQFGQIAEASGGGAGAQRLDRRSFREPRLNDLPPPGTRGTT